MVTNNQKIFYKVSLAVTGLTCVMSIIIAVSGFWQATKDIRGKNTCKSCNCTSIGDQTAVNMLSATDLAQTPLVIVPEDNLSTEGENVKTMPLISSDDIGKEKVEIPAEYSHFDLSAKPYMDYRKITNQNSNQYKLIHSDEMSVDERGFLVDADGYIGVALGSYFGEIGSRFEITLDTGVVLKVIKVEEKSDLHTCENNFMGSSGDVIEFVIDTQKLFMQSNKWRNGYIFSGDFNNCYEFTGNIVEIEKVI